MAILTSGRTPTVRGALVWPKDHINDHSERSEEQPFSDNSTANTDEYWKETVRSGDYSRMLYAPGDGVILRRSAVALPGGWKRCLVRGDMSLDQGQPGNPLTNDEGVVETSHRHVTLLSDVDGIGRCLEACRRSLQNCNSLKAKE